MARLEDDHEHRNQNLCPWDFSEPSLSLLKPRLMHPLPSVLLHRVLLGPGSWNIRTHGQASTPRAYELFRPLDDFLLVSLLLSLSSSWSASSSFLEWFALPDFDPPRPRQPDDASSDAYPES